jgi:hypothetical protein
MTQHPHTNSRGTGLLFSYLGEKRLNGKSPQVSAARRHYLRRLARQKVDTIFAIFFKIVL